MHSSHKRSHPSTLRNLSWSGIVLTALIGMAGAGVSAAPQGQQAQTDKGREAVGQVCVACHTNILRMVQIHKESPAEWRDTVYSMIARGAQLTPDQVEPVIAYLSANGGAGANAQASSNSAQEGARGRRAGAQQASEAEGRTILQRSCQQCHDLATASTKKSFEEWGQVITKMVGYGAKISPADAQILTEYLDGPGKSQP